MEIVTIALILAAVACTSLFIWATTEMGFTKESVPTCESEFIGWMAKYYYKNSICEDFSYAYTSCFKVYKEYLKDENIDFLNPRYSWTRLDAEMIAMELILRED